MIGLFIVFNIGYYVVFTFLPTYFIKTLKFSKSEAFVSITLACLVALILILPLAAWWRSRLRIDRGVGRRRVVRHPVRFSGFSVGYNVCVALFGGTTPYLVTWLTATTGNAVAPAYYLVTAAGSRLG